MSSQTKEEFLRDFFARQREIGRKSLAAVSDMAARNSELIALNGINEVASRRVRDAVVGEEPGGEAVT